jgi:hypothetical protein
MSRLTQITREDLRWWLEFAATREWTFAKSYAATAPHDYIVQDRTPEVSHEDTVRAARVIHTFGQPGKYYSITKIYLRSPDGLHRWWTEDEHFTDTTLVNRATNERSYGIQNAPSTHTGVDTAFDTVATTWDEDHPAVDGDAKRLHADLQPLLGKYPPHVLDIGCGTGRTLDLGIAVPRRYAAVDQSQAMLNMLIRKHSQVAKIYPSPIECLLDAGVFTPYQFDIVVLDRAVELTSVQLAHVERFAQRAFVVDGEVVAR